MSGAVGSRFAAYSHELRAQWKMLHPEDHALSYRWGADGGLVIPATGSDGFEVAVQPGPDALSVTTDVGWHDHMDGGAEEAVRATLGLVRDLLSPDMRVRELLAGGRPYRWHLERRDAGGWTRESTSGFLLWNYIGRRSERFFQNHHLPGRLTAGGQPPTGRTPGGE